MEPQQADGAALRSLFLKALSLPATERASLLNDPAIPTEIREEVAALLNADEGSETLLRDIVTSERSHRFGAGERFGPFETRELLGRGGMGAVFRAERVDGELSQTVAIKIVERAWLDPSALDRFRRERQFLARLVHANIARLLDGGTRPDGIAYLVMEYVDGLALDRYCEDCGLGLTERLRLFLPLCDAVDYAHQKLIIHRDLKPSNVLVTASGEPKLLDFGIAKTLETGSTGAAQTLVLTPDFASPEQVRGEEITTRTDVYGLGAVLYFLLTGRAPHEAAGLSPAELQRTICERPPERPGVLRPALKGDLENILLKALHVEPGRRYGSARELAEEVECYLSHRPVRATPDGWSYRVRRFVERHRFACAAGTLATMAIVAATALSLYEAHRAQQRFAQVRTLANRFLFDFEAAIHDTPGTLTARRMVTSTAREHLAILAADSGRDPALRRELAQSYYRLSGIEVNTGESNLAIEHIRQSIDLCKALKDDCCGTAAGRQLYLTALGDLIWYQQDARALQESSASSVEALRNARAWIEQSPREPLANRALANLLSISGNLLPAMGRVKEARQMLEESTRRFAVARSASPGDDELGFGAAQALQRYAKTLGTLGETDAALAADTQARQALDPLIRRHPDYVRWRILRVAIATSEAAFLDQAPGRDKQAFEAEREAYLLCRDNVQQNPGNKRLLDDLAVVATRYANRLTQQGKPSEAEPLLREAGGIFDQLVAGDPSNHRYLRVQFNNRLNLGYLLMDLKRWGEAAGILRQGEDLAGQVTRQWPDDLASANGHVGLMMCLVKTERNLGHLDEARRRCRLAFEAARDLMAKNKEAKTPVENMELLREEGRILGVPDLTPAR